jgi:hypothetical protein
MADFCQKCSIRVFGEDMKDFAGMCLEGLMKVIEVGLIIIAVLFILMEFSIIEF